MPKRTTFLVVGTAPAPVWVTSPDGGVVGDHRQGLVERSLIREDNYRMGSKNAPVESIEFVGRKFGLWGFLDSTTKLGFEPRIGFQSRATNQARSVTAHNLVAQNYQDTTKSIRVRFYWLKGTESVWKQRSQSCVNIVVNEFGFSFCGWELVGTQAGPRSLRDEALKAWIDQIHECFGLISQLKHPPWGFHFLKMRCTGGSSIPIPFELASKRVTVVSVIKQTAKGALSKNICNLRHRTESVPNVPGTDVVPGWPGRRSPGAVAGVRGVGHPCAGWGWTQRNETKRNDKSRTEDPTTWLLRLSLNGARCNSHADDASPLDKDTQRLHSFLITPFES
ncbi:hypothetical protein BDN67DRAFT_983697 [Paxillus ammoniavirescens]|nr:hypothetical protein BDN67DRAFT_983697 [Paxillus ammoniavirescens]